MECQSPDCPEHIYPLSHLASLPRILCLYFSLYKILSNAVSDHLMHTHQEAYFSDMNSLNFQ